MYRGSNLSKIHEVIEHVLRRNMEEAARGEGKTDPRGEKRWIDVTVATGMNEIGQWLNCPEDVEAHLAEIQQYTDNQAR